MTSSQRASLALVLLFVVSLPAVTPRIYAADEVEYFAFLRSLWFDHDLSFDNEYRYFDETAGARIAGFRETFLEDRTPTGLRKTFATIGCALLWAPFYGVADAGVHLARMAGSDVLADGYSRPYLAAVAYGSAVYGFLALLLSVHACTLVLGPFAAGQVGGLGRVGELGARGRWAPHAAAVAVWLGTPLLFYMYVAPPYSHACSAFAVAAFVVTWLRVRRTWSPGGLALLGALGALMAMVREQDVVVAGGAAIDFAWTLVDRMRHASARATEGDSGRTGASTAGLLARAAIACAVAAVTYLPQAIAYLVVNGRLGPSHLVTRKMSWIPPHAWQVLADPEHGFLLWTPLAVFALGGLVVILRRHVRIGVCLLATFALQVYVNGSISSWTVAGAFGHRRFVALTIVLVIGLVAWLSAWKTRRARAFALTVVAVAVWWNVALIVQFGTGMMDRRRLELGTNACNAFVRVPRELPHLAYRYVFDRKSFYAAPKAE